jgi:hypothetical protein
MQTHSLRVVEHKFRKRIVCGLWNINFANVQFASWQNLFALFAASGCTSTGDDSQNLVLAHNQQLFAVDFDL